MSSRDQKKKDQKMLKKGKPYYDILEVISQEKLDQWKEIIPQAQKEVLESNRKIFISWPEKHLYADSLVWKVIPILYTLPANKPENTIIIKESRYFIPTIYDFVMSLPNVRTALVSRLSTSSHLQPHQGYKEMANYVLRSQFPIITNENSGLVVLDKVRYYKDHDAILFDDSLIHSAFNNSDTEERYVLIVDFKRPENARKGRSEIGDTNELTTLSNMAEVIGLMYRNITSDH